MGRTNPTYRNYLDNFIDAFKPFERGLRKQNKKYMVSMWEKAHTHAHAGSYMNSTRPGITVLVTILLGLQKEVEQNQEKIERLENRLEELED